MTSKIKPPKLGEVLQPGDAGTVTLIEQRDDRDDGEWGATTVSAGLAFDFDAAIIVDGERRGWLKHTRESILTGQKPEGGEADPLGRRALEAPGRQSENRLFKTGTLADGLYSDDLESDGRTASATCKPPRERTVIVAKERRRGRNIMTTEGAAGAAALEGARLAVEAMLSGRRVIIDRGAVDADEVK